MLKVETLASSRNPLIMDVRRAARAGSLTENGCCLAESFHLLDEILRGDCPVEVVLASQSASPQVQLRLRARSAVRLAVVPDRLFDAIAATEASQGVMALVRPPAWTPEQVFGKLPLVIVLDGIQDPGNAGAILRAAEAFGASGLIFAKGTVSAYNPKAVRASAGSVFRVPLLQGLAAEEIQAGFQRRNLTVYASAPNQGQAVHRTDLARACAVIIGSEGRGVSDRLREGTAALHITTASVESLNAAMAAGIVLYEAQRQRGVRP
jgi:RNA methyltransferase, TrmH family